MTAHNTLNAFSVKNKPAGKYCDGRGLWLVKSSKTTGKWILRYSIAGKRREMGLGSFYDVSLKNARESAIKWRRMLTEGLDPIRERDRMRREAIKARPTFGTVALECFEVRKAELKGDGKNGRWFSPLELHILPYIGRLEIEDIDQNDIKRSLEPIWHKKAQTAKKALGRINIVMRHGAAMGLDVDMQAVEKAKALLGAHRHKVKHIPAMPWHEVPAFYKSLDDGGVAAQALQFLILTLARTSEIRKAEWKEIKDEIWTIPAQKTKTGKEHRVPLTNEVIDLLEHIKPNSQNGLLFSARNGNPISDMTMSALMRRRKLKYRPHGFRSSFRDWVAEATDTPREVAEACLAHSLGSTVELSYRRTDYLEKRRGLMEKWASIVSRGVPIFDSE